MIEKPFQSDPHGKALSRTGHHRCLPCLRGDNPERRDCAIRHLLAEGHSASGIEKLRLARTHPHDQQ